MTIEKVEIAYVMIECKEPQGLSSGPMKNSTDGLCRITTSDGIRGIGLGRGGALPKICGVIQDLFKPLLIGENPIHNQYLWEKLRQATLDSEGRLKPSLEPAAVQGALCAVDLALWDIKGKAAGMSICELLGGKPHPVLGYIQKGFYVEGQSLEEMADEAVRVLRDGGFTHLKMRVGRNGLDEAEDRVAIMRKALGDDVKIMVDVNGAWDLEEALEGARRLAPYDLLWMEEPMGRAPRKGPKDGYDWNGTLGKFSEKSPIALAAGENHQGLAEFWDLATRGKPRYMQLDIAKQSGGLTEWARVQPICQAAGILMAPHVAPHFHVQLVAAAPNGFIIEICDNEKQHPAWPDLYHGFPEVRNGHMECPTAPGWGMEINDEMVRKHGTVLEWDFGK